MPDNDMNDSPAAFEHGPEFGKIVIFGVGLIGGSFALALKSPGRG